jgi:alpha-amylase
LNTVRTKRTLQLLVLAGTLLVGCGPSTPVPPAMTPQPPTVGPPSAATPSPVSGSAWWNSAVFYEIFVRSFYDGNGDGIGDLAGLIDKLDYLNDGDPQTTADLGITGIWLMPVMEAYSYHGYDVIDYYTVESDYGDNALFQQFVAEAHARGIRVIVDLVLNHTSTANPWFINSSSGPDAPDRDWYIWSDSDPGYSGPWGEQVWYRSDGGYYYAIFWEGMPDLNYRDPAVTAEMYDVARFWLEEMGVDGFRLDAVQYLIEDGNQQVGTPQTHAWLADFHRFCTDIAPDTLTVGEVWANTPIVAPYVADDEMTLAFEFDLADAIVAGVESGDPAWFAYVLQEVEGAYPHQRYAPFLTNHDQDRVMSQLDQDGEKAHLAATVLLTLPGVPFIYYGEEIGMTGQKPDERIRTPMQWDGGENAGFTTGLPWEALNGDYETTNVVTESGDQNSLLNRYRRLIQLHNQHVALQLGGFLPLNGSCHSVYGFLRYNAEESTLVLLNFADQEQSNCSFSLPQSALPPGDYAPTELLAGATVSPFTVDGDGGFSDYVPVEVLAPEEGYILLLEPAR